MADNDGGGYDTGEGEYDSGPFCGHWSDPIDCEHLCANCGHRCGMHYDKCSEDGCTCEEWKEMDDPARL